MRVELSFFLLRNLDFSLEILPRFPIKHKFQQVTVCRREVEDTTFEARRVARNSQGGAVLGVWGFAPSRRRPMGAWWGSGSKVLSCRRHEGLGADPPALKNFAFFCKNNNFRAILIKNKAFKTWLKNWQCKNGLSKRWLMVKFYFLYLDAGKL